PSFPAKSDQATFIASSGPFPDMEPPAKRPAQTPQTRWRRLFRRVAPSSMNWPRNTRLPLPAFSDRQDRNRPLSSGVDLSSGSAPQEQHIRKPSLDYADTPWRSAGTRHEDPPLRPPHMWAASSARVERVAASEETPPNRTAPPSLEATLWEPVF